MASVFTRIIEGEIPGRFVWRDDRVVAFLTAGPITPGHTLVVPIVEIDHWLDLDDDLAAHLTLVAKKVGRAQKAAFSPLRVGMIIAGLEVPHCHMHVLPIDNMDDLSFANVDPDPDSAVLDAAADQLRAALHAQGDGAHVPAG